MTPVKIIPTLLSIAGSDPSGGAGIQADLKTICSIGVYGAAAVTCLTVQNSKGVKNIFPLPAAFVEQQITAVLSDHHVTHIKVGMTGTSEIIRILGKLLQGFSGEVIVDPVLTASTGESLFADDGLKTLKNSLLRQATYLTPNIMELSSLAGTSIDGGEAAVSSSLQLLSGFPKMKGIVIKGGHLQMENSAISDYLIEKDGSITESRRPRLNNKNLHGTGCTYASAFASYLCLGNAPAPAFLKTGNYMHSVIEAGIDMSAVKNSGNGPLCHHLFP